VDKHAYAKSKPSCMELLADVSIDVRYHSY
jgi:hypothetical protein